MPSPHFKHAKYALDKGGIIVRVKVKPEVVDATLNPEPTGDFTSGWPTAKVSIGRKGIGIRPRYIVGEWKTPDGHPDGYDPAGYIRIVILTKAKFDAIALGQDYTYLTFPLVVIAAENERIR